MAGLNVSWAIEELRTFVAECRAHTQLWEREHGSAVQEQLHDAAKARMPIVERIADCASPDWRSHRRRQVSFGWEYEPLVDIAAQTLAQLERQQELVENLGEAGPSLHASTFHRDVWDAAQAPWRNGHFGDAVRAVARSVNAQLQTKVDRRDESDAKLVGECFSLKPPTSTQPRLRLMGDDGSDTYASLHEGAAAFGRGCFMAIRNVLAHEYGDAAEPPELEALEYLAAFSVLARWVDEAIVVHPS
jgi:hypothetical protein